LIERIQIKAEIFIRCNLFYNPSRPLDKYAVFGKVWCKNCDFLAARKDRVERNRKRRRSAAAHVDPVCGNFCAELTM
jgi:hypothetical protein